MGIKVAEITRSSGMRVFSELFFLSVLVSIKASRPDDTHKLADTFNNLVIADKSGKDYGGLGFAGAMQIGEQLKEKALKARATLKDIVKMLEDEMRRIILFVDKEEVISWITQVFVCFYEIDGIYTYDDLHEISLEENAKNFLRASIAFNHYETFEEFLPFLISSYKSDWYHEGFWTGHKVDWSMVELSVILEANNPKFLEDFMSNKLPFMTHHRLSSDKILDLVAEHDFLDIFNYYKNSGLVIFEQLHKRIGKLVEFGSVKLLRALHGFTGENLNLQEHVTWLEKLPERPEDWEFLKKQGYKYMPVHKILWAACKGGHTYILDEFHKISIKLVPTIFDLEEAARGGHWDIIKWAINNGISNEKGRLLLHAILNGHFEFIQLFESEYNLEINSDSTITKELYGYRYTQGASVVQSLADKAAGLGRSRVVGWISDKFNVLPKKGELNGATVRILKLLKLKKPEIFDTDLPTSIVQMSSIKWMWNNYSHLFTDKIKKYWTNGYRNGSELRWIHKNWKILPEYINWNISVEELDFFIKATEGKVNISGVARCAIREGDFEKVKFLISKYPSCLKREFIDTAMEYGNIEITNMLDKHFRHRYVDLLRACRFGHLEILKRSLEHYICPLDQIKNGVFDAIEYDQLEIVDYMMNKEYVNADRDDDYMSAAIRHDSIRVFKFLIEKFGGDKLPEGYLMDCWKNRSFKIFTFILLRLSKSKIKMLLEQDFDSRNHHLRIIVKEEYEKRTQGV